MITETECIGMDVHDGYSTVAIMAPDGTVFEPTRVSDAELEAFAREHAGAMVAMGATGVYRHIYTTLDEYVDVTLVNPKQTRLIAESSAKTDALDAKTLAKLLKAQTLSESYVPPAAIRQLRDLVRERKRLIDNRTRYENRIRSVLKATGNSMQPSPSSQAGRERIADLELDSAYELRIETSLTMIDALDEQISTYDSRLTTLAQEHDQAQLLMTIRGVGEISAMTVIAEIGEIERFPDHEKVVSYAGLDPTVRQSGEKETHGPISKDGSAVLRWILVQCANNVVLHDNEYFKEFYLRKKREKNKYKAKVATARKVLVSMYYMLTRGEEFDPNPPGG